MSASLAPIQQANNSRQRIEMFFEGATLERAYTSWQLTSFQNSFQRKIQVAYEDPLASQNVCKDNLLSVKDK